MKKYLFKYIVYFEINFYALILDKIIYKLVKIINIAIVSKYYVKIDYIFFLHEIK
jgi:hypothetical protein